MAVKIMIVDDSATIRQQVTFVLERAGYEVVQALDGQEGVAMFKTHTDISAIICDVNMPNLDGFGFLTEMSKSPATASIPTVMLTTEGNVALVEKAKLLGAKGWLVKPFNPEQLITVVKKLAGAKP